MIAALSAVMYLFVKYRMKLGRYLSDCILFYMPSGQRVLYLMDEIFFNLEEKNN